MSEYAMQILGPGHVILSRRPEDVQAALLKELWPQIEAYRLGPWWWAISHRHRSRLVTRRKQRSRW